MNTETKMVLLVGYDKRLLGGVAKVTNMLLENIPQIKLHPYLVCYHPLHKALGYYLISVFKFVAIIFSNRKFVLHVVVGSKGDAIRAVPYLVLARLAALPTCIQYHKCVETIFSAIKNKFIKKIIWWALNVPSIHCFLSGGLRDTFLKMAPFPAKTQVIPNALPDMWFENQALPFAERPVDVVFFGRWSSEKGVDDLIKCLARVSGTLKCEVYTNQVPSIEIQNVSFKKWVGEAQVMQIMRGAKLLVLPSYSEAYPTVILEALACGTPFVATAIAGIPDIAKESSAGSLFQPGDIDLFVHLVQESINNKTLWEERSWSGREWVYSHCNKNKIIPLWLELYGRLRS